jgi:hypothetical protein
LGPLSRLPAHVSVETHLFEAVITHNCYTPVNLTAETLLDVATQRVEFAKP